MSIPDPPPQGGSYVVEPTTGERKRVAWTAGEAETAAPAPAPSTEVKPSRAKKETEGNG